MYVADAGGRVAELSRIRCYELLSRQSAVRHQRRFQKADSRVASPRYQGAGGSGVESRVKRAPVFPGSVEGFHVSPPRLVYLVEDETGSKRPLSSLAPVASERRVLLRTL